MIPRRRSEIWVGRLCSPSATARAGRAATADRWTGNMHDPRPRYPAIMPAGSVASGSASELLQSLRVVGGRDRRDRDDGLVVEGAQTQDERDQGEHVSLEFLIAASQHGARKWRCGVVAANATGSIAIAPNVRMPVRHMPQGLEYGRGFHG